MKALREFIQKAKAEARKRAEAEAKEKAKPGEEIKEVKVAKRHYPAGFHLGYYEALLWRMEQRAFPNDGVDNAAYGRAVAQRNAMAPALFLGAARQSKTRALSPAVPSAPTKWEFVGPRGIPAPYQQFFGPLNSYAAGRVNDVAYAPSNASIIYIASAGGGIWKSTDGGANWTPKGDRFEFMQTSGLAVHPTNPNIVYVGVSDFNGGWSGGLGYPVGLMKTTDGGETWTNLARTELTGHGISAIVIDPDNPNIITVTTGRSSTLWGVILRSTNGGQTWSTVTPTGVFAEWTDMEVSLPDPTNGNKRYYYATVEDASSFGAEGVYRSDNNGQTWTRLANTPNPYDYFGAEIATSKVDPRTVYYVEGAGNGGSIYKSTNAGASWTNITGNHPSNISGVGNIWNQCWYDLHLTTGISNNQDVLYCGTITLSASVGGNTTWVDVTRCYNTDTKSHSDQHGMAINPSNPNEMMVANDGGMYKMTYNPANQAWTFNLDTSKTLGLTQFYHAAWHPTDPARMLGGAQDNSSPAALGDLDNWRNPGGGDGAGCAINPTNPNIQFLSSQNLSLFYTNNGWTTNNPNSFDGTFFSPNWGSDAVPFIGTQYVDPNSPHSLYVGTNYLNRWAYNNTTGAGSWSQRLGSQQLAGSSGTVVAIAVPVGDSQRIYAGSTNGQLWMSTNGGSTWRRLNPTGSTLPSRAITSININPTDAKDILVGLSGTGSGHIYRTTNSDAATPVFTNISGTGNSALPDIPLNGITRDLDDPQNTLYVATDVGVFATINGGQSWTNATEPLGLPNVECTSIQAVPGTGYLNVATFGRGMWRIPLKPEVRGEVALQGISAGAAPHAVIFEFRPSGGGQPIVFNKQIGQGTEQRAFSFMVPPGQYNLAVKGDVYLRTIVPVNTSSGSVTLPAISLLVGDLNNDNKVNLTDLVQLRANYNKTGAGLAGDLNGDGKVNLSDLVLLRSNYGKTGQP